MNFEHNVMKTSIKSCSMSVMANLIADKFNEKFNRKIEVYEVNFGYVVFLHNLKVGDLNVIKLYYTLSEDVLFNSSLEIKCKMLYNMFEMNFNALFDAGTFDSLK